MNTENSSEEHEDKTLSQDAVSSSLIKELIDKYEDKLNETYKLKQENKAKNELYRLSIRIHERKTFIKDLKSLLNDC